MFHLMCVDPFARPTYHVEDCSSKLIGTIVDSSRKLCYHEKIENAIGRDLSEHSGHRSLLLALLLSTQASYWHIAS
eukprot:1875935-Amphidinium_carterae.1